MSKLQEKGAYQMDRSTFLKNMSLAAAGCSLAPIGHRAIARSAATSATRKPNFVIIFIDDMGYGDIEPFGSTTNSTPHLNRMAKEGMKLTSFYKDISALLFAEPGAKAPHDVFFYKAVGVRSGKWKFLTKGKGELYNLEEDIGEKNNVASQHPDTVKRLRNLLQQHVDDLERNSRPAAFVENPKPILPFPEQ
jgi:hypothetical protein